MKSRINKKKRSQQPVLKPGKSELHAGVAWYTPENYERLLAVTSERSARHDTHSEWLASATQTLDELRKQGLALVKVQIDVDELAQWCREKNYAVNGKACSEFVQHKLMSGKAVIVP